MVRSRSLEEPRPPARRPRREIRIRGGLPVRPGRQLDSQRRTRVADPLPRWRRGGRGRSALSSGGSSRTQRRATRELRPGHGLPRARPAANISTVMIPVARVSRFTRRSSPPRRLMGRRTVLREDLVRLRPTGETATRVRRRRGPGTVGRAIGRSHRSQPRRAVGSPAPSDSRDGPTPVPERTIGLSRCGQRGVSPRRTPPCVVTVFQKRGKALTPPAAETY